MYDRQLACRTPGNNESQATGWQPVVHFLRSGGIIEERSFYE
jgi:hypothetical protein